MQSFFLLRTLRNPTCCVQRDSETQLLENAHNQKVLPQNIDLTQFSRVHAKVHEQGNSLEFTSSTQRGKKTLIFHTAKGHDHLKTAAAQSEEEKKKKE